MSCALCDNTGRICENHRDRPSDCMPVARSCTCGGTSSGDRGNVRLVLLAPLSQGSKIKLTDRCPGARIRSIQPR
jgi:hypothetical protein